MNTPTKTRSWLAVFIQRLEANPNRSTQEEARLKRLKRQRAKLIKQRLAAKAQSN